MEYVSSNAQTFKDISEFTVNEIYPYYYAGFVGPDDEPKKYRKFKYVDKKLMEEYWDTDLNRFGTKEIEDYWKENGKLTSSFFKSFKKNCDIVVETSEPMILTRYKKKDQDAVETGVSNEFMISGVNVPRIEQMLKAMKIRPGKEDQKEITLKDGSTRMVNLNNWEIKHFDSLKGSKFESAVYGTGLDTEYEFTLIK